ncbi:MAG: NHLP bacteriocin export ABC transporter permease/ATPase subunit [Acidobacteriota bacterium]
MNEPTTPAAIGDHAGGGSPLSLPSNRTLDLTHSESRLWLVDRGRLELFMEPWDGGRATGPRLHLGEVTADGGLLASFEAGGLRLIAVATEPTELTEVNRGEVTTAPQRDDAAEALGRRIDGWIASVTEAVPRPPAPHHLTPLRSDGTEQALEAKKPAGRPAKGLLWVRLESGEARYLGIPELALAVGETVPSTGDLWLTGDGETVVSARSTQELLKAGTLEDHLRAFHQRFLTWLEIERRTIDEEERQRLGLATELDRRSVESATERLVSILDSDDSGSSATATVSEPMITVCRLIGEFHGFEIRIPPEPESGKKRKTRLEEICAASRLRSRRVLLRDDWWRHDNGPLIGVRLLGEGKEEDDRRAVALLPTSPRSYDMVDPVEGTRQPVDKEIGEALDGNAFMLYPPLPEGPLGIRDLVRAAFKGRRRDVMTLIMMGLCGGLLGMVVPLITGRLFGQVIPSADRSQLAQLGMALVVSAVATGVFEIVRGIAMLRLGAKVDGSVQAAVWNRLLSLPMSFFRRYTVGDLADRSLGLDAIRELLAGNVTSTLLTAIFSVFSFGLLFYYSWRLALVATAIVLVLMVTTTVLTLMQIRRQRPLFEIQGKIASLLLGLLHGVSKLRVAGAEKRGYALWAGRFAEQRSHAMRVRHVANLQAALNSFYGVLASIAIFAMLGLSQKIQMPIGDFLAFIAAFSQFLASSLAIIGVLSSVLAMVPTYERLVPILVEPPEVDESRVDIGDLRGDIEFNHVSFRYKEDGPLILDDVSLEAKRGEMVALVGPSGSGKSTCIRLILGFETPEAGSIYFDGQDLSSLALQSVRRQIGVVLQNGEPMVGDIYSNIVGSSNLGIDAAWEAAAMAGLAEDIAAMPMKMHTIISEGAGTFSGGQKQRLLIARAVVHRPRVLLFDEATSALDNRTQDIVSRSLEQLDATRIVVAHRLSTILNADRIYVIDRGRVMESGTYAELARAGGVFSTLVERQEV